MESFMEYLNSNYLNSEAGWQRVFTHFNLEWPGLGVDFKFPTPATFLRERTPEEKEGNVVLWSVIEREEDGRIVLKYWKKGADLRVRYTLVDVFSALKENREILHIDDPMQFTKTAARMLLELGDIPPYAKARIDSLRRYRDFDWTTFGLSTGDAAVVEQVFSFLYNDLAIGAVAQIPVGHSVRRLAEQLGLKKEMVNRAVNLLCLSGLVRKDRIPSSREDKRPDRFWVRAAVTTSEVRAVIQKLISAGLKKLHDLTQTLASNAGLSIAGIFRRQRDDVERRAAGNASDSFLVKHILGKRLNEIFTRYPEALPQLPEGCEWQPVRNGWYKGAGPMAEVYRLIKNDSGTLYWQEAPAGGLVSRWLKRLVGKLATEIPSLPRWLVKYLPPLPVGYAVLWDPFADNYFIASDGRSGKIVLRRTSRGGLEWAPAPVAAAA
ncbi:hypothetical protein Desku_1086 [Desulfofundulus kuznetsovii DSM 6115]|uniref:Uncharacterized protein n=1 Tax=Desulfofundulus kuznetsovii (strain DSM 6115 / VKM B-1805 / 17) TaxID=760568 RepID=A0AAU8P9N8_DESK7|nr:hypothetical protein Desku_1086 [Desulfofundulus kuznetsovii DSM 6115]